MNAANGPAAGVDDIRKDLQTLREDVMRLAGQVSTLVGATGDQALGDGKQRMRQMGDAVSDIGERGRTWRLTCSKMSARRLRRICARGPSRPLPSLSGSDSSSGRCGGAIAVPAGFESAGFPCGYE